MKVFTINLGEVFEGAAVESLTLKGAGISIPAIIVGEEGRGSSRGVLPVQGATPDPEKEGTFLPLMYATLGSTRTGNPKLFACDPSPAPADEILVVFRTHIGFRGSNNHTGDRAGWKCRRFSCDASGTDLITPEVCPVCGAGKEYSIDSPERVFAPFPGQILVSGVISQGAAGRMGSGQQHVAVIPKNVVFRTAYGGRLYGRPSAHYYRWDGSALISVTWDERIASDVF